MWQVRFYCRMELNYNGEILKPGDEWTPAGLLNDAKIMYNAKMVRPEYEKVVRRTTKK